jgi:hypothetical protein
MRKCFPKKIGEENKEDCSTFDAKLLMPHSVANLARGNFSLTSGFKGKIQVE